MNTEITDKYNSSDKLQVSEHFSHYSIKGGVLVNRIVFYWEIYFSILMWGWLDILVKNWLMDTIPMGKGRITNWSRKINCQEPDVTNLHFYLTECSLKEHTLCLSYLTRGKVYQQSFKVKRIIVLFLLAYLSICVSFLESKYPAFFH